MKNLQLMFSLDIEERTDNPSGNVLFRVHNLDTGIVESVFTVSCNLASLRIAIKHAYEKYGDMVVPGNTGSTLYDYEYIHATMQAELDEYNAKAAAEKAQYENERNLKTAKKVMNMLSSQSFDDFYNGAHEDFITGEPDAKTEDEILEIIVNKFIKRF